MNITTKDRLMHLMAFLGKKESEEYSIWLHMAKTCFEITNDPKNKRK